MEVLSFRRLFPFLGFASVGRPRDVLCSPLRRSDLLFHINARPRRLSELHRMG